MFLKPFYSIPINEWILSENSKVRMIQEQIISDNSNQSELNSEFIRQWVIRELVSTYGYPSDWLNNQIILGENLIPFLDEQDSNSIILSSKRNNSFLIICIISQDQGKIDFAKVEKDFESILTQNYSATIGVITSGVETKVIRKIVQPANFEYISDIPEFQSIFASKRVLARADTKNSQDENQIYLQPLPKRLKNLFFEIHSAIRDIDGLHDDLALDELCKLIYAKIYDEKNFISKHSEENQTVIFQVNGHANESEIASDIRILYQQACSYDQQAYSDKIPGYEKSRGVFKEAIALSDNAIAKIVEKVQNFSITDSDTDIKGVVFQQILNRTMRSGFGQFFTPLEIIQLAVEVIGPKPTDFILDPFCGSGHFLTTSAEYVSKNYPNIDSQEKNNFKISHLHGIEKSARMVRIAMTDMLLHNDGYTNIRNADSFSSPSNFLDIQSLNQSNEPDSLAAFDIILTNPPFGKILGSDNSIFLNQFTLASMKKSIPLEILALERCFQFLKKGGKLAIVLPDGNLANSQTQYVRDWILDNFKLKAVVSLPQETFAPYGTTTKTSLCFFQKFVSESNKQQNYDIAFYKLDNIGYDATGREISGNELSDAINYLQENICWD